MKKTAAVPVSDGYDGRAFTPNDWLAMTPVAVALLVVGVILFSPLLWPERINWALALMLFIGVVMIWALYDVLSSPRIRRQRIGY